jgi:hypothetical protein
MTIHEVTNAKVIIQYDTLIYLLRDTKSVGGAFCTKPGTYKITTVARTPAGVDYYYTCKLPTPRTHKEIEYDEWMVLAEDVSQIKW